MTATRPPRLATALLHRVFDADEPLVGDLLEGFERNRSPFWFWKQTLSVVLFRARQRPDHTHPLGLAPRSEVPRFDVPASALRARPVNLSASPLTHAGGLGLVVLATLTAVVRPQAWWIVVPVLAGGVVVAAVIVAVRRP